MRHVSLTTVATVLVCISPYAAIADSPLDRIRSNVEGVYALVEWHLGDRILRPPDIDGRFVLRDGVAVVMIRNWSDPASKVTTARFGKYTLESAIFAYGYDDDTVVTETTSGTKVTHRPAEAMRAFTVSSEADGVHLRRTEGQIEFFFSREGLIYSENGKALRVWRRIKMGVPAN